MTSMALFFRAHSKLAAINRDTLSMHVFINSPLKSERRTNVIEKVESAISCATCAETWICYVIRPRWKTSEPHVTFPQALRVTWTVPLLPFSTEVLASCWENVFQQQVSGLERKLNRSNNRDVIEEILFKALRMGWRFAFRHDNELKHTAKKWKSGWTSQSWLHVHASYSKITKK